MRVTKADLRDVLIAAIEGGVNYWAAVRNYQHRAEDPDDGASPMAHVSATLFDPDEVPVTEWHVDADDPAWRTALERRAREKHMTLAELVETHDADDADAAVQYMLFGELRYS